MLAAPSPARAPRARLYRETFSRRHRSPRRAGVKGQDSAWASESLHEVSVGLLRGSALPGRIIRMVSFFTTYGNTLCRIPSAQSRI
jgi:hypothetical protein